MLISPRKMRSNSLQIITTRIYGSLVHIRTVGFQENIVYFASSHKFAALVLKMPKMECEGLNVQGLKIGVRYMATMLGV